MLHENALWCRSDITGTSEEGRGRSEEISAEFGRGFADSRVSQTTHRLRARRGRGLFGIEDYRCCIAPALPWTSIS